MIRHEQKLRLVEDLIRATSPSETPSEEFKPSGWSDRIYYLLHRAGVSDLQCMNWNQAPALIAMSMVMNVAQMPEGRFERLESVVAEAITQRFS